VKCPEWIGAVFLLLMYFLTPPKPLKVFKNKATGTPSTGTNGGIFQLAGDELALFLCEWHIYVT